MQHSDFRHTCASWVTQNCVRFFSALALSRLILPVLACALIPAARAADGIVSVGSNTLEPVVRAWGEAFRKRHPEIPFSMQANGTVTALPALTAGDSNLAPASRALTRKEAAAFEAAHGYAPTGFRVALDALAVYVHKDNPIKGLSMDQVDAIFSKTQACQRGLFADTGNFNSWSDLSFSGLGAIRRYGRNQLSGTYDYFRKNALCDGEFKDDVEELADSQAVIDAVAADPSAIGYAGIGYRSDGARAVALSPDSSYFDSPYYGYVVDRYADDPNLERRYGWVVRGRYPLSRYLYLYVNRAVTGSGDDGSFQDAVQQFVEFALSDEGQAIVHDAGFIPLPGRVLRRERSLLADR